MLNLYAAVIFCITNQNKKTPFFFMMLLPIIFPLMGAKTSQTASKNSVSPRITSISPNTIKPGRKKIVIQIRGRHFTPKTTISTNRTGIKIIDIQRSSHTLLRVTARISDQTAGGRCSFIIKNPGQAATTAHDILTIKRPPTCTGIIPRQFSQGIHRTTVQIRGQYFMKKITMRFPGDIITVRATRRRSPQSLTAIISVPLTAPPGPQPFQLANPEGSRCNGKITILKLDVDSVYFGNPEKYRKPAAIVLTQLMLKDDRYQKLRRMNANTAEYWLLWQKINRETKKTLKDILKKIHTRDGYDLIGEKGYLKDVPDITAKCLKFY